MVHLLILDILPTEKIKPALSVVPRTGVISAFFNLLDPDSKHCFKPNARSMLSPYATEGKPIISPGRLEVGLKGILFID